MPIEFHCPQCNKTLRTSDEKAGRTAKCPDCGESITVPGAAGAAYEFDSSTGGGPRDEAESPGMKTCPMCGEEVRVAAVRCRHCGETIGTPPRSMSRSSHLAAHRGGLILAFGILAWAVCPIFGPFAWVMGNTDLAEMKSGRMDPSGEGLTVAGKIIGMIFTILMLLGVVLFAGMMCLGVAAG